MCVSVERKDERRKRQGERERERDRATITRHSALTGYRQKMQRNRRTCCFRIEERQTMAKIEECDDLKANLKQWK